MVVPVIIIRPNLPATPRFPPRKLPGSSDRTPGGLYTLRIRSNPFPVDHILSIPGLSDDDRISILGGTAAKLLGIN